MNFDFRMLLKQRYQDILNFSSVDKIVRSSGVEDIVVDERLQDDQKQVRGTVLIIKGRTVDQKAEALLGILRKTEQEELQIFVPEAVVSMIIGKQGRTIN